jgi:hypothetical protein
MTESNNLRVFDVPPDRAVFVLEPFRESLNSESRGPKTDSDRLG